MTTPPTKPTSDDTEKIQFNTGDLNPVERPFIRRSYDDDLTSGLSTLSEAARAIFEYDVFEGIARPFRAIVLRDESDRLSIPIESSNRIKAIMAATNSDENAGVPNNVKMVRCRIPEIHTMFPEPGDYLDEDNAHIIDLYPLFVGLVEEGSTDKQIAPGSIVEVDFGNLNNQSDPIFVRQLKPVGSTTSGGNTSRTNSRRQNGTGQARNPFNTSCRGNYPGTKANGAPLKYVPVAELANVGPKLQPRYAPINAEKRRGEIPSGKGMFLLGHRGSARQGKEAILKRCKWAGLSFVCLLSVSQSGGKKTTKSNKKRNREVGNYLAQNGIQVFMWGFPHSTPKGHVATNDKPSDYREIEFAKAICEEAIDCGALGVITDPEAGYYIGNGPRLSGYKSREELAEQAIKHIQIMRQIADKNNLSVGITSYGGTPAALSKSFPFESFAAKDSSGKSYADFAIPQVYASRGKASNTWAGEAGVKKSLKWWADTGFINIIPALGAYGKGWEFDPGGESTKSPARMAMEAQYPQDAITPGQYGGKDDGTVMWWEWGLADDHRKQWPQRRWDVIKSLGNQALESAAEVANTSNVTAPAPGQKPATVPEGSAPPNPPAPKLLTKKDAQALVNIAQSDYDKALADSKKQPPPHEFETALGRAELALEESKAVLTKVEAGERIPDKTAHVSAPAPPSNCKDSQVGPDGQPVSYLGADGAVRTQPKMKRVKIQLDRPRRSGRKYVLKAWCAEKVSMREDIAANLKTIVDTVHQLGGVFISAGAGRGLGASKPKPGAGRVLTSFHYTNLAIDLHTGMSCSGGTAMTTPEKDEYVITFDPKKRGTHGPLFIVWAWSDKPPGTMVTVKAPDGTDVKFEVQRVTLPAIISDKREGIKPYTKEITGNYFNLTAIMNAYGFRNIGGRKAWYKNSRGASEWWHFQADNPSVGVVKDKTTFGDVLETMHDRKVLITKPVAEALDYVWVGTYFKNKRK